MKKIVIISLLCVLVLALVLVLVSILAMSRVPIFDVKRPDEQQLSQWESSDGTIQFEVKCGYYKDVEILHGERKIPMRDYIIPILGITKVNGEDIEFYAEFGTGEMRIYPPECLELTIKDIDAHYEILKCSFRTDKHFVATVEESTYLEEGQKIHFYRTYPK